MLELFPSSTAGPFGRRLRRERGARIPVTVVTGFLGAGKTTLVRHFLSTPEGAGTAVIVNEFGETGIDDALLPALRAAASAPDPARVVNIGSIDGLRTPSLENYSYSASKAAVHMLTRHLAKRLASDHITVNAIAPGPFESKMTAFMLDDPESREMVAQMVPLQRIGQPDDVAGLTLMLCSRAGAYLTGTVIPLDGGITGCN